MSRIGPAFQSILQTANAEILSSTLLSTLFKRGNQNHVATFSGDDQGDVLEDATSPVLSTSGTLIVSDRDAGQSAIDTTKGIISNTGAIGTLTIDASGHWNYTVDNNAVQYLGQNATKTEIFTVTSIDGTTHDITIVLTGTNDIPIAQEATVATDENTPLTGVLYGSDIDNDTLTYSLHTAAENGTVVINTDGTYTYTPNTNYFGSDSFAYTISDGHGGESTANVVLNIASTDTITPPESDLIANPDSFTQSGWLAQGEDIGYGVQVIGLTDGGWIYARNQMGNGYYVTQERYDANGIQLSKEAVGPIGEWTDTSSAVALSNGGWVTAIFTPTSVLQQAYNSNGEPFGSATTVYTSLTETYPGQTVSMANTPDGGWVIALQVSGYNGSNVSIYTATYNSVGDLVHSVTIPTNLWYLSDIGTVSLSDGSTAITYSGTDSNQIIHPVYYQHLDTNGNLSNITSAAILNDIGNGQYSATSNVNGGFTLTWETYSTDGFTSSNQTLHMQSFNANGQAISNDVIIEHTDTSLNDIQYTTPNIITLNDDSHLVEYIKNTYDLNTGEYLSTHEIRRYSADGEVIFTSSTPTESGFGSIHATALADGGWLDIYQGGSGVYEARYDANSHHVVAVNDEDSVLSIAYSSYTLNDEGVIQSVSLDDTSAYDSAGHVVGNVHLDVSNNIIFTPNDYLDSLGEGVVENVTFNYTLHDSLGAVSTSEVSMAIEGKDDANSDVFTLNMDQNINFAALDPSAQIFSGVDIIDLNSNGNHSIDNLSLDDVLFMTDADHTLTILGDVEDNVSLATPTNGYSVAQSTEANFNVYTYHSDNAIDPTVVLKIDQDVHVTL